MARTSEARRAGAVVAARAFNRCSNVSDLRVGTGTFSGSPRRSRQAGNEPLGSARETVWQLVRHFAVRFMTVALTVACTLVCLEIFVFAFEPQLARFFQYDEELGFRVKPYSDATNSSGSETSIMRRPKRQGRSVSCVSATRLGGKGGCAATTRRCSRGSSSARTGAHRVDVINVGYPMTTTNEQLRILRRYGMAYHPDLVVLGFFAGNDFIDSDSNRRRIALMDTYLDIDVRHPPPTLFGRPLMARSRLWALANQRAALVRELLSGHAPGNESGSSEEAYLPMTGGQIGFDNAHAARPRRIRDERPDRVPVDRRDAGICRERGRQACGRDISSRFLGAPRSGGAHLPSLQHASGGFRSRDRAKALESAPRCAAHCDP